MSCSACKRNIIDNINDELNFNHNEKPKKGIKRFFQLIGNILRTIFLRLFVIVLLGLMLPVVFVMIMISVLIGGRGSIKLPKKLISYFARKK